MPRYRLDIEYDGSAYAGWQRQAGQHSVQAAIEQAIKGFCAEDVTIRGAGRTDAGVHAAGRSRMSISPASGRPIPSAMPSTRICRWRRRLSACLPWRVVADDFDARFSAIGRHYLYRIVNRRAPLAIEAKKAWWIAQAARCRGHARGRAGAGRQARLHYFPLRAVPGEEPGEDARPARCDKQWRGDRNPRLGALLPAQPGPLDGRFAEARRRGRLERGRPRRRAGSARPRRLRPGGAARRALSR